jgi:hypothetical protein
VNEARFCENGFEIKPLPSLCVKARQQIAAGVGKISSTGVNEPEKKWRRA